MEKSAIRSRWILYLVAIVFAGVVAGGVLGSWAARKGYPLFTTGMLSPTFASNMAQPGQAPNLPGSFAPVIQPDLPGVVYISTTTVIKRRYSPFPFNDPFFQQFFGQQPQQNVPEKEYGLGSGVIVRSDGVILTNNHVVHGADDIRVTLQDKKSYKAKVLGTDPRTDLAVIKIDATGLTALPLGASTDLKVGDIVFAIGDPFGVGETVTMGIISAKNRANVSIEGPNSIQDFIQTDAAINPGNSGGALINTKGQVIGINTAIVSGGGAGEGGNIGIGFAIPINLAKSVMEQIVAHGKVVRGQLGVYIQAVSPEIAQHFGLSKAEGALVASVNPGSAAAKAGIKQGDIILKFNGQPVADNNELLLKVSATPPGTTIHLEVFRDGKTIPIAATLEEASATGAGPGTSEGAGQGSALAGVQVQTLTADIANQLGLSPGATGVVVTSVDPSSPAADALQRGMVIQEVNHRKVTNLNEYNQAVQAAGTKSVLLLVNTHGQTGYVVISPSGQ
ncbi:MAG: Do family serine endopeptidase [Acidobacteriota bacterium]|nr:Do family serine endopeptidase [Acidobacteriota bacterium]